MDWCLEALGLVIFYFFLHFSLFFLHQELRITDIITIFKGAISKVFIQSEISTQIPDEQ